MIGKIQVPLHHVSAGRRSGETYSASSVCIVGLFVTIPVTFAAITIAYQEIVGFDQRTIDAL